MKILKSEINGIKFYHREGMSDLKTFNEVIGNEVYLKKGMTIKQGETWMDCGGNVGAFTLLACSKGAKVKKWNNKGLKVSCINFDLESKKFDCCKMDIEGAEMPILEETNKKFNKLVFEWSFDIDGNLNRFRNCINKLKNIYDVNIQDKRFYELPDDFVPKQFIVKATNIFCYEKN
jgi:hypothetical protein